MPVPHDELISLYPDIGTIATVGASTDPDKPSHSVPAYLIEHGFRVLPVNPNSEEIFGIATVASLEEIRQPVDVVQVFRPAEEAPAIAEAAVALGARILWLQLGIVSDHAAQIAERAGLTVVMNACMRAVHMKYVRDRNESGP
jgi:hypothetical protein